MIPLGIVVFFFVILPLLWFVGIYNGLIRIRNHCAESFSNIETELKRRHNLIPNLVRTVKSYAAHEKEVFQAVTEARTQAQRVQRNPVLQQPLENQLAETIGRLMAVVEAYPDLKADQHFLELQGELVETENRIQHTRRIYNANVRDMNNRVEMFPSSMVAGMAGIRKQPFFELSDVRMREVPQV